MNEGVDRLLKAERPRAAFSFVRLQPEKLDAQVLFRLLSAMATGGNDKTGTYRLQQWNVEQAFKHPNASPVLTRDQKAGLEFAYLEMLARRDNRADSYGIPNLERYIEAHPEVFVQAVAWAYKRKDGGTDPVGGVLARRPRPQGIRSPQRAGCPRTTLPPATWPHGALERLTSSIPDQCCATACAPCLKWWRLPTTITCRRRSVVGSFD
jgi:hypothetical protein